MAIVYFDSSAFVKLLVEEDGSDIAAALWDGSDATVSSRLPNIAHHAGHLAEEHALRGADAVHLASVLAIGVDETVFAVWDHRLHAGAQEAGLQLAPRE